MKTTINKSRIMKRAWSIFKGSNPYSYSFSASLRRAWEVEKANIASEIKQAEKAAEKAELAAYRAKKAESTPNYSFMATCADQYKNAARGTYFGD